MKRYKGIARSVGKKYLVLCEGNTEIFYFNGLKRTLEMSVQRSVRIDICSYKRNIPKSLVKEAQRRLYKANSERDPFNAVWVVFDHDNHPDRREAFDKAVNLGIRIGFSSISIEYWFLLHFTQTAKPFLKADKAKEYLRKNYIKEYREKVNLYLLIGDKTRLAIDNARWLRRQQEVPIGAGSHITDLNPITTVDSLVKFMLDL